MLSVLLLLPVVAQLPGDAFDGLSRELAAGSLETARPFVTDDCWFDLERPCDRFVQRLVGAKVGLGNTMMQVDGGYAVGPAVVLGRRAFLLFRKTDRGWQLDDVARDEARRDIWLKEKPRRSVRPAPLLAEAAERLKLAIGKPDADAAEALCAADFWKAPRDGGKGMFEQLTRKQLALEPRFTRAAGSRGFAVFDVIREGKVRDRVWLLAHERKGAWRFAAITEDTRYVRAFLAGTVGAPFDADALPSNSGAQKALGALRQALLAKNGAVAAKRIVPFAGETPGIGGSDAADWLKEIARNIVAVGEPRVRWLGKSERGIAQMLISYTDGGERYDQHTWLYLTSDGVVDLNYGETTHWLFGLE